MNRSTYFLMSAGALASVVFMAACVFVFVAGAYRPPENVTATPQSSASEPTATERVRPTTTATLSGVTGTPESATDTPASSGDPERGRVIFSAGQNQAPPCSGCHATVKVGRGFAIGPNLSGVADRAGSRIQGMSAEAYLMQSILHPREFVVPGFRDMMYAGYVDVYSTTDVSDIVAYLMTLHEDLSVASQ